MNLAKIYDDLSKKYGPQGWWPILNKKSNIKNQHYFILNGLTYGIPYSQLETHREPLRDPYFEIAVGAILTQNINWKNVACAIEALHKTRVLTPQAIVSMRTSKLEKSLYCTRYYAQKAKKVKIFSKWLIDNFDGDMRGLRRLKIEDLRLKLLDLWGIGRETADSIILFALNKPIFMIDEYTRRFCVKIGVNFKDHDDYRLFFEKRLNLSYNTLAPDKLTKLYQEFHALIVREGQEKQICRAIP